MNKITDKNLFGNIPKSSGEQFAEGEVLSPGVTPKRQHLRAETWQEAMMAPGTVERDGAVTVSRLCRREEGDKMVKDTFSLKNEKY